VMEIFKRIFEPTPILFKNIRNIFLIVHLFSAFVIALHFESFPLPNWLLMWFGCFASIYSAIIAFVCQLTSVYRNHLGEIDQGLIDEYLKNNTM